MPKRASARRSEVVRTYFTESSGYWNRVYHEDSVKAQVYLERQSRILEWIDDRVVEGAVVGDIGAGAGHLAVALATRGFEVVAIDNSEEMLRQTSENAEFAGVEDRVTPIISDPEDLKLPDDTFDVVVAVGLIPWVEHPPQAIAEMVRVVKPGGHVILTMDNAYGVVRVLDPGWHARPRSIARAIRIALHLHGRPQSPWPTSHTWSQVKALLQTSDLAVIERRGVGFGPLMFLGRHILPAAFGRRLDRTLQRLSEGRLPLLRGAALFHIVLAQKPLRDDPDQDVA